MTGPLRPAEQTPLGRSNFKEAVLRTDMQIRGNDAHSDTISPSDSPTKFCTRCSGTIDPTEWHPVATVRDDEFEIYPFCSERCREEWERE